MEGVYRDGLGFSGFKGLCYLDPHNPHNNCLYIHDFGVEG